MKIQTSAAVLAIVLSAAFAAPAAEARTPRHHTSSQVSSGVKAQGRQWQEDDQGQAQEACGQEGPQEVGLILGLSPHSRSNLNTATLAIRLGWRRTTRPRCRPKASSTLSRFLRASTSKSAKVPTRMLGVSYHS